jgi:hypothetical protein
MRRLSELREAYPALVREWAKFGCIVRREGVRGTPDFMLTCLSRPGVCIFAEVKAVPRLMSVVKLERLQAIELDALNDAGLRAFLLVRIGEEAWSIHRYPFSRRVIKACDGVLVRSLDEKWFLGE